MRKSKEFFSLLFFSSLLQKTQKTKLTRVDRERAVAQREREGESGACDDEEGQDLKERKKKEKR